MVLFLQLPARKLRVGLIPALGPINMLDIVQRLVQIALGLAFGLLAAFGALAGLAIIGTVGEGHPFLGPVVGILMILMSAAVLKICWDNIRNKPSGDKRLYPESMFVVTLDDTHCQVTQPNGKIERLALDELSEVSIVTNSSGPWGMDVWWLLSGREENAGCAFPGGATGEEDVLQWTKTLQGFDVELFVKAMCCTTEARFVCWSRPA